MVLPNIWLPPQTPITGVPWAANFLISSAKPVSRKYVKSANVFLEPGRIIKSGLPITSPGPTNRTDTSGS